MCYTADTAVLHEISEYSEYLMCVMQCKVRLGVLLHPIMKLRIYINLMSINVCFYGREYLKNLFGFLMSAYSVF